MMTPQQSDAQVKGDDKALPTVSLTFPGKIYRVWISRSWPPYLQKSSVVKPPSTSEPLATSLTASRRSSRPCPGFTPSDSRTSSRGTSPSSLGTPTPRCTDATTPSAKGRPATLRWARQRRTRSWWTGSGTTWSDMSVSSIAPVTTSWWPPCLTEPPSWTPLCCLLVRYIDEWRELNTTVIKKTQKLPQVQKTSIIPSRILDAQ